MTRLSEDISKFFYDPLGYIMYAFPWGEVGTALANQWPDPVQVKILNELGKQLKLREKGEVSTAIRMAIASGHGIGKSALTSWIILWFLSTRANPQAIITAGTAAQLNTKTWREVAKWKRLAINGDWFEWTATKLYMKNRQETWFASALAWSENNPDSFAGTHEDNVLVIFDEASSIADVIWETVEGAMTTPGAVWLTFSNPVRNAGRFRECFGKFRHRWLTYKIDSRESSLTNKEEIEQWRLDYGEDSDFFKVRVLGEFPSQDDHQFINLALVRTSIQYEALNFNHMPVLIGVDVALRQDKTVIAVRQGRKLHFLKKYHQLNAVQVSHYIAEVYHSFPKASLFIDAVGVGDGIVDFVKAMGIRVIPVNAGLAADDSSKYFNKRAEMWGRMKQWFQDGAQIPNDDELIDDLTGITADYNDKGQLLMEKKASMRARGLSSPDCADALAHTFFMNIRPDSMSGISHSFQAKTDWSVY